MEQISTKPIIVEFNGIPGAGKTTTGFEIRKLLKSMEIKDISPQRIMQCKKNYKELLLSKKKRDTYIMFLKAFFLVRPITWERLRFMNMTFDCWLGIEKMCTNSNQKKGICILDQGVIQGFVSIAYRGRIRNEKKYYRYIVRVMDKLDNVICVNCNIDADVAIIRMGTRKPNGGRLYQICSDKERRDILVQQQHQFERIRERLTRNAFTIDMKDAADYNAEKIVKYCLKYL